MLRNHGLQRYIPLLSLLWRWWLRALKLWPSTYHSISYRLKVLWLLTHRLQPHYPCPDPPCLRLFTSCSHSTQMRWCPNFSICAHRAELMSSHAVSRMSAELSCFRTAYSSLHGLLSDYSRATTNIDRLETTMHVPHAHNCAVLQINMVSPTQSPQVAMRGTRSCGVENDFDLLPELVPCLCLVKTCLVSFARPFRPRQSCVSATLFLQPIQLGVF
ncbi:hypothetical protein C8Q80DRAFT_871759 [Daedaleopsis nitida]|nr:hypothetical protein C8Q80DRAFT_871759 [Daedaleopsis nitida]